MKKSNLLLGLGALSIATIPAFAIVSCSGSSDSSETQKIYDNLFEDNQRDYNQINFAAQSLESLKNANVSGSKTINDIVKKQKKISKKWMIKIGKMLS